MEISSDFTVPATPDEAFRWLLDLENVAPCMPGATLTGHDGDRYEGELSLRVGPIVASYTGELHIVEVDEAARRAVLQASGRERRGQGSASARVHASVSEAPSGSRVEVLTELDIRGKAAQFGRGVLADVSNQIVQQFASNIEAAFTDPQGQPAGQPGGEGTRSPRPAPLPDASVDVLGLLRGPLLERALPLAAAFVAGLLVGLLRSRSARRAPQYPWPPPAWWPPQPPDQA